MEPAYWAGFAPLRLGAGARTSSGLALGNAFAGGVFLGAGLLHMLPDAQENFATVLPNANYPLPVLMMGAAILVILLTDQIGQHSSKRDGQGRSFLLFVVLALHSVIAGASLGLETAVVASVTIFIAIIAHKGAAGFALGTALESDGVKRPAYHRMIILFAATTPFGVALGTYLSVALSSNAAIWFESVFDALAAGTFLYIALVDIFKETFRDAGGLVRKFALAAVGFGLMAAIAVWA